MNCAEHSFYSDWPTVDCQDCLREALRNLRNEAAGVAGMPGVRELIGNTNLACFEMRISEAEELLNLSTRGSVDEN